MYSLYLHTTPIYYPSNLFSYYGLLALCKSSCYPLQPPHCPSLILSSNITTLNSCFYHQDYHPHSLCLCLNAIPHLSVLLIISQLRPYVIAIALVYAECCYIITLFHYSPSTALLAPLHYSLSHSTTPILCLDIYTER